MSGTALRSAGTSSAMLSASLYVGTTATTCTTAQDTTASLGFRLACELLASPPSSPPPASQRRSPTRPVSPVASAVDRRPDQPLSALPSPGARAAAFVAILVGGLAGGLIGYSLVKLQCDGDCALPEGLGILVGAVATARA